MPMKNRILNTHTNFSDISTSQTAANQPNDFPNTHTWRYHRSHRRSRKIFFECTSSRRRSFPSETEYILLPSTRILQILSTHKERRRICAQQISKLRTFRRLPEGYAVSDEQAHGKNSEGDFRRREGRKEERMKEGRRKEEKNWLVILAAMVLRYRSTIYFVALEEIAIASALLRGSLVLSGPLARGYVPWPFAVPD